MHNEAQSVEQFIAVMDHGIRAARRYRRYFTLVSLSSEDPAFWRICSKILAQDLRESDLLLELPQVVHVIMEDTEPERAQHAVKRLRKHFDGHAVRAGLAGYPDDGDAAEALLAVAKGRLEGVLEECLP